MYKNQDSSWFFGESNADKMRQSKCAQAKKKMKIKEVEFKSQFQVQENKMEELIAENAILKQQLKVKKVDDLLEQMSDDKSKSEDSPGLCLLM